MQLQLSATISLKRVGTRAFRGITVDMSRSGVLIEALEPGCPVLVGDTAYVEIELPTVHNAPPRCMACNGRVVRIDKDQTRERFAVSIDTMQFQNTALAATRHDHAAAFVM